MERKALIKEINKQIKMKSSALTSGGWTRKLLCAFEDLSIVWSIFVYKISFTDKTHNKNQDFTPPDTDQDLSAQKLIKKISLPEFNTKNQFKKKVTNYTFLEFLF